MRNERIGAGTAQAGTFTEKKPQVVAVKSRITAASKAAGHEFCKVNYYHPLLKEKFPGNPKMWSVDKYYPYAKGGPLYIDEPNLEYRIVESKRKLEEFKKAGVRYLILLRGVEPLNEVEGLEL